MKKYEFMNSARELTELINELERIRDAYIKVALTDGDVKYTVEGGFEISVEYVKAIEPSVITALRNMIEGKK